MTWGIGAGGVLSILPIPFALLSGLILAALCLASLARSPSRQIRVERGLAAAVATLVLAIATYVPLKDLDRQVGPMHYEAMRFEQLARALSADWRVFVMPDSQATSERIVTFRTSESMSRRQVLQKLARDCGGEVRIRTCGTTATVLFGGASMGTILMMAQPVGPANGSQPIRSETNRTSWPAGSRR
jgi:hypothetical protein